jgi:hypothetical protein
MSRNYTKKPEIYEAAQYDGTNYQEILDFCPEFVTRNSETGELFFQGMTIDATSWVLKDRAGIYQIMINSYFNNYFQLQGPA